MLTIEYTKIDDIHPHPDNPKDHDIGALSQSFERFGYIAPGAINEETGYLIYGHGRFKTLLMLREQGEKPPKGITDDWEWPIIRGIHLSEEDGRAYMIADNRHVELGGWNEPDLLDNLMALDDLAGTGYDDEDLQRLMEDFNPVDVEIQPRLDQKKPTVCPECGHEFIPKG